MPIKVKDELLAINVLTILLVLIIAFMPLNVLRLFLGLPVALFFPGYTLLAALFPRKGDLGGLERIALSFGLSVIAVALIGLILNYTRGVRLYPVLLSVTLFIMATSVAVLFQRHRLSPEDRFGVSFNFRLTKWAEASRLDKGLAIGLMVAILVALEILGYAMATRQQVGERFTQFYILGLAGEPGVYPGGLVVGEEATVMVRIINQEREDMTYRVEVIVDGIKNREIGPVVLAHEEEWEQKISFTPARVGKNQKVEFLLYKNRDVEAYHRLYLWIDINK